MNTLKLTVKAKWFGLIAQGVKAEEYREIKDYWIRRIKEGSLARLEAFKHFDFVELTNGYSPKSRKIKLECNGIAIGEGRQEWGAEPGVQYFIIKLGREVERHNF